MCLDSSGDERPVHAVVPFGGSSTSKRSKQRQAELLQCFLCEDAGATCKYRGLDFHNHCQNATRAHYRLLVDKDDRVVEDELALNDAKAWRSKILPLVVAPGEARARATISQHKKDHIEAFVERSSDKGDLLLTKTRFIKWMEFNEGYNSESASESFDRRVDGSVSEHYNSDDEPRARVKDNERLVVRRGSRTTTNSRLRSSGHGARRGSAASDAARSRSRDRRRRRRTSGCRAPSPSPAPTQASAAATPRGRGRTSRRAAASKATPRRSPQSSQSQPAVCGRGSAQHSGATAAASGSFRSRLNSSRMRRSHNSADLDAAMGGEAEAAPTDTAKQSTSGVAFMAAKDAVAQQIEQVLSKTSLKSWVGKQLTEDVGRLGKEQLGELAKEGSSASVLKQLGLKVAALQRLKAELPEIDKTGLEDFRNQLAQAIAELNTEKEKATIMHDAAKYLLQQIGTEARKKKQADRYQRVKLATRLTKSGSSHEKVSSVVAELVAAEAVSPVPTTASDTVSWTSIMLFDDTNEQGKTILAACDKYAGDCADTSGKIESLKKHMKSQSKQGGMVCVSTSWTSDKKSTLSEDIGLVNPLMCEDRPGAAAWLASATSFCLRSGPSNFPLPGVSCLIRLAEATFPVTVVAIGLKPVVEAGLTVLSDLLQFAATDSGAKIVKDSSTAITLNSTSQILYLPMGMYPLFFARESDKDETGVGSIWVKTLMSKTFLLAMDAPVWPPVGVVNREVLQKLSGQQVWKSRMEAWDKLAAERAWQVIGAPPTLNEVAAAEASNK